jgi:hypothetical protein
MVNHLSFELEALKILTEDSIKKKDMTIGNKIMNKCIGFRSTAVISYTQIQ